ncbi:MAG: hydrogenase maturation nickel metallochaperone HypA [Acidobacteriota bacterium]
MHEAAIIQGILEVAERQAREHGACAIKKIKLKVGEFRGVVREALEFSFAAMKLETMAHNSELEIETIKLRVHCQRCGEVESSINDFNLLCPKCNEMLIIIAGRELQIEYLDIE